jgi:hypothetical protein
LFASPTERKNKNDVLNAFNYAFEKDFKACDFEIVSITENQVYFKFACDYPHHLIPDKRAKIYYIG